MLEWTKNNLESIQVLKISIRTNHELSPSLLTPSTPTLPTLTVLINSFNQEKYFSHALE